MSYLSVLSKVSRLVVVGLFTALFSAVPINVPQASATNQAVLDRIDQNPSHLFFEFKVTPNVSNRVEVPLISFGSTLFNFWQSDGTQITSNGSQSWSQGSTPSYDQLVISRAFNLTPTTETVIVEVVPNGAVIHGLGRIPFSVNHINIGSASCEGNIYQGVWSNWANKVSKVLSFSNNSTLKFFCGTFYQTTELVHVASNIPSTATNLQAAFQNSTFNAPINWNLPNVVTMRDMFYGATSFSSAISITTSAALRDLHGFMEEATSFNGELTISDTSAVTDFTNMFAGATTFNQPLSLNTAAAQTLNGMFWGAESFNQPIGNWDIQNVTNLAHTFESATSFNQDLSLWTTSAVTVFESVFKDAATYNQPLAAWDMSSATTLDFMFEGATSFNKPLGNWDVSSVTSLDFTFEGASAFNQDINSWDVSSVTNLDSLFRDAISFNQPLDMWDVSQVVYMPRVFLGATSFNQPLGNWTVSSVTTMHSIFENATSFNQDINDWDVSSVTTTTDFFRGAAAFNQPLSQWSVSSVSNMGSMFSDASSFDQDLGSWQIPSLTAAPNMFLGSGLSCANYDSFLNGIASSAASGSIELTGVGYTPAGAAARETLVAKGWVLTDSRCPGAWPTETPSLETSANAIPLILPRFSGGIISGAPGSKVTVKGDRFDLILSAQIDGQAVSISDLSNQNIVLLFPEIRPGNYSLVLETTNGRVTYLNQIEVLNNTLSVQNLQSIVIPGVNPRSSWLDEERIQLIQNLKFEPAEVVCIAYNDKPGIVSRKKAMSRAIHACRVAERQGVQTRVFVYAKAPKLGSTVKLVTMD